MLCNMFSSDCKFVINGFSSGAPLKKHGIANYVGLSDAKHGISWLTYVMLQ